MGRLPEATISEIRSRVEIIDLVGRYVQLKKAGRNHKGLCPFHDEKTPSFNVNPDRQVFHCFGCQAGGDVVILCLPGSDVGRRRALEVAGAEIAEVRGQDRKRLRLRSVHEWLWERRVRRTLLEAGPKMLSAHLDGGLVDQLRARLTRPRDLRPRRTRADAER